MEETLKLTEFLELSAAFTSDPQPEKMQPINDFINKIQVKDYLTLADKEIICVKSLGWINDNFSVNGIVRFLEFAKIYEGLFSYCVNLENDLGTLVYTTPAVYDTIFNFGLYNYIISKCKEDYERLCRMIDSSVNALNITKLVESVQLLDGAHYDEWVTQMKELKKDLDSDTVKNLVALARQTDGSMNIQEELSNMALEKTFEEAQKTKDGFDSLADSLDNKN